LNGSAPVIVWFRQDLRLADNPAFSAAAACGQPMLAVYVLDDGSAGQWAMGAASRWWLHRSLASLDASLDGRLCLLSGRADRLIPELVRGTGATAVYINECVEPWRADRDVAIAKALAADRVDFVVCDGTTLFDHSAVLKQDGTPYRVFTPFWRKGCLQQASLPREPLPVPRLPELNTIDAALDLDALGLMPSIDWHQSIDAAWQVGEQAAMTRLDAFLERGIEGYREGRNFPDQPHVSRLSPHLHFGEISPSQVWHATQPLADQCSLEADVDCFRSELGWREFSYYLLRYCPELPENNLQQKFDRFPWRDDNESLQCWQRGMTGIPLVDAGMRELWQTGYMHNRVRMIVGSFLVKNLLLHWRLGEQWFWDTLVDADLANNSAGWQWVAGSGTDAAPYFRIFNPVTQGQKFDAAGTYVRRYVPELEALDERTIHTPWEVPPMLRSTLDYPPPIVDLKDSRERALTAFQSL